MKDYTISLNNGIYTIIDKLGYEVLQWFDIDLLEKTYNDTLADYYNTVDTKGVRIKDYELH